MTPTLQQFAEAFERVWAKDPGAPRLPEGYGLHTCKYAGVFMECPGMDMMPETPALALCVTTAMDQAAPFGASVQYQPHAGGWVWSLDNHYGGVADSLPSAALAMLEVIGGG